MNQSRTNSILLDRENAFRLLEHAELSSSQFQPVHDIREQVKAIDSLPPLPEITRAILELYHNPLANAADLAKVVEMDPSLSAQVLKWANSAMYGFRGEITTIQAAIARVLGYDVVMNLAMALTTIKPLNIPREGPIGQQAFWSDALFSSMICQRLALRVQRDDKPNPGTAYLSGLLHNIWMLLLGHLFPTQHKEISELLIANPELSAIHAGEYILGINPIMMGRWLLESWELPDELLTAITYQNDPEYQSDHEVYANLVLISERLLRRESLGYGNSDELPDSLILKLGLDTEQVQMVFEKTLERREDLLGFSSQLAG
ncbi:MAG: HDOD domain-containing protein [Sedimenticola sp.]